MELQDYYEKHLTNFTDKAFSDLDYYELKQVRRSQDTQELAQDLKKVKNFLWKNAITILTLILGVLAISYGIAIQIFKIINTDA